jgi:hypothetical protein
MCIVPPVAGEQGIGGVDPRDIEIAQKYQGHAALAERRDFLAEVLRHMTRNALEAFPEVPPCASGFPASTALADRIPEAKLPWHIPPGNARAGDLDDRLDEQTAALDGSGVILPFIWWHSGGCRGLKQIWSAKQGV